MVEADFQKLFSKHVREVLPEGSAAFELKFEKGISIAFNKLAPHQKEALLAAKYGGLYHKLTDMPHFKDQKFRFDKPKPFDCMFLRGIGAFVVVMFYVPRGIKEAFFIDIEDWCREEEARAALPKPKKSMRADRARAIAKKIVTL